MSPKSGQKLNKSTMVVTIGAMKIMKKTMDVLSLYLLVLSDIQVGAKEVESSPKEVSQILLSQ